MRITKLHLLLFFLLAGLGVYGAYFRKEQQAKKAAEETRIAAEVAARQQAEMEAMSKPAPTPAPVAAPVKEEPKSVTYTVKRGDTLWKIAKMKEHFGKGHRWYDVWKANEDKISDFDHLVRGQELVIPLDKPDGYAWPKTSEKKKRKILSRRPPKTLALN